MPQAIVIGAGPAGSMASILLARGGWRVTLIEQQRFPRNKVCGECISALGIGALLRSGLDQQLLAVGAVRLSRSIIHARRGGRVEADLPRPMWGLSRARLDTLLLEAAVSAGVFLKQPARAEVVTPDADHQTVRVRARDLISNVVQPLHADFVIVADGKAALGLSSSPDATGQFGIKTHFENVNGPRDAIELFSTAGTYGGLAPIEDNRWNAAFSAPSDLLREFNGDLQALFFERFVSGSVALRRRLMHARPVGPWLAAPLPRFGVSSAWPARVIPIGNAAAALEPIGGEGIGLAMRSAELAAEAIIASANQWTSGCALALRGKFRRLWQLRRAACRTAAIVVSSALADDVLSLAEFSPAILNAALRLVGK